jgi:hypothetical protein
LKKLEIILGREAISACDHWQMLLDCGDDLIAGFWMHVAHVSASYAHQVHTVIVRKAGLELYWRELIIRCGYDRDGTFDRCRRDTDGTSHYFA